MDKDGLSPNDLNVLMTQLWCRDFKEFRGDSPDRARVQLSAAMLLYCFTSARTGEVYKSIARRATVRGNGLDKAEEDIETRVLAACYKHFTLTIKRVDRIGMLVLTYQREYIKGYWRKQRWELPVHAFYEIYKEDTPLFFNLLTFFLPMASADRIFQAKLLNQCFWSGCQGPLNQNQPIGGSDTKGCPSGYKSAASRFDTDDGGWCSLEFNSALHDRFKQGLCCLKSKGFNRCQWATEDLGEAVDDGPLIYDPSRAYQPRRCKKTQTKLSEAYKPAPLNAQFGRRCIDGLYTVGDQCSTYPIFPEYDSRFYLCCDPPSEYDENWPVPPSWLWENAYKDE